MYDTAKVTDNITLDKILSILDPYDIYTFYIGKEVKLNKPISSPLRDDKNPSWSLFKSRSGDLLYKDFATGDSGNVVTFVSSLLDLPYHKTLERIWADMMTGTKLKNGFHKPVVEKISRPDTVISVKRKYFTKTDDDYWEQYGIDRDILKQFSVSPIDMFWTNDVQNALTYSKANPMYAYKIFDKFKIYRPLSEYKKDKWRNNCGSYDLQGLEQLPNKGELLIITKSLKDVMVLFKHGYSSISPSSENTTIPKPLMDNFKKRFKNIIVFYDYDEGGVKGAEALCAKFNLNKVFIPKHYLDIYGIKDISDFAKEMSEEKTIELLKELFDER